MALRAIDFLHNAGNDAAYTLLSFTKYIHYSPTGESRLAKSEKRKLGKLVW